MVTADITISNKLGLHARAATKFANVCNRYACTLEVCCNGKTIDGKSIMSLMLLAAAKGSTLSVVADGQDEQEALQALVDLVNDRFGESE